MKAKAMGMEATHMRKYFDQCVIQREKVKTFYTLNVVTGEKVFNRTESVTESCGTPLFGELESKKGICKSCASGWSTEGNKITATGLLQLADTKPIRRGDHAEVIR